MLKQNRQLLIKVLLLQIIIVSLLTLFFYIFKSDVQMALSVMTGGLIWIIPNAGYAIALFSRLKSHRALQIVAFFILGELVKLIISAALFIWVATHCPVKFLPMLVGYVAAILAAWFAFFSPESKFNPISTP